MNWSDDTAVHGHQVDKIQISLDAVPVGPDAPGRRGVGAPPSTMGSLLRFGGKELLPFGIREAAEWFLNGVRAAPRVRSTSPEARLRLAPYARPAPEEWR